MISNFNDEKEMEECMSPPSLNLEISNLFES
jgi:hypothetical protein